MTLKARKHITAPNIQQEDFLTELAAHSFTSFLAAEVVIAVICANRDDD